MAVFKSVINVNNGNTGWTRQHVLDALEIAFGQLGFNGGTAVSGSPVVFQAPGNFSIDVTDGNWRYCGGPAPNESSAIERYFYVTNNGTSSYNLLEQWYLSNYSIANDTLTLTQHTLVTGNPVVWNPSSSTGVTITPLVNNTTYYVIKVDGNTIKLAATLDDATNGIAINLTAVSGNWNTTPLRRAFNVLYNNYQIDVEIGDTLKFEVNDTGSGGNFFLIDSPSTGYAANRVLSTANFAPYTYKTFPTGQGTTDVTWQVRGWPQTESENMSPEEILGTGNPGIFSYGYGNSANAAMKGVINVIPSIKNSNSSDFIPYWKYTVPASGSKSSLKIKVFRFPSQFGSSYRNKVAGIQVYSKGSGWGTDESFTIPGSAIGGVDGTNDILVGVNSLTTAQQNAATGVCTLIITNYGAGTTMYQKSLHGHFAVLKNVNDATKTFGTTYYGFSLHSNNYRMYISSGPMWRALNVRGINTSAFNAYQDYGSYGGDRGLDYQESYNYLTTDDNNFSHINIASSSTPTAYPLSIRLYKAQSPQDTNFAVIQFTQTINNEIIPFGTFSIHKGSNFGSNVWDLNHVWNGGITTYEGTGRHVSTSYFCPGWNAWWGNSLQREVVDTRTLAREANYGYVRNTNNIVYPTSTYSCNIDTNNSQTDTVTYYRNSTYDGHLDAYVQLNFADRNKYVSSSANYYKPMKGIPISNHLLPCPYYLPDDYIMLQVATAPGLTEFRPGDTITVSASEIYEIIISGYQTAQNGLDNVTGNNSIGMVFAARTT